MTGLVCVVSLGAGDGECARELEALGRCWERRRGGVGETVGSGTARAVSFGSSAVSDGYGWTVRQGVAHGVSRHPVTVDGVGEVDGQHCLASHDAVTGSTVLATDRFAAAPLYVARRPGLLMASTSALVLASHLSATPNADALRNFLVSGYQFGTETHWRGIDRLEPGTALEVTDGRVREIEYWAPHVDEQVREMDLSQLADHMIEVSVSALRERLSAGRHWIDLTGGYDSRLLALLLDRAGVSFQANTRQTVGGADVELAGAIAEIAGWKWEPFRLPGNWAEVLADEVEHALAAADGRLEVLQLSRVSWMHRQLAARGGSLLSAGGGEHLQFYAWNTELFRPWGRTANIDRWVDMIALKPADTSLLAEGSRSATREMYIERLRARAAGYSSEPASRQLDVCYAYKSAGHFGAYRAADDMDIAAQLPFFFEPIFTAAFSAPRKYRGGFRLMRTMMERLDPRVAAVQSTRGGPALPMRATTLPAYLPYYGTLGRKGINKLSGQVLGRPIFPARRRLTWSESDSVACVVQRLEERGSLDWTSLRSEALFSKTGIERLHRGEADATMMGRFLTLEMSLATTGAVV